MPNPPIRPLGGLDPWATTQALEQLPRDYTPMTGPIVGRAAGGGLGAGGGLLPGQMAPDVQTIRDPHRYARLSGSARLPVGTASGLVLGAPPTWRNFLVVRNLSAAANIFLDFGIAADVTRTPIRLIPDAMLFFTDVVPQDDMFAVADAAGGVIGLSFSNVNYSIPNSLSGV
jgi:hypothetical protein